MTSRPTLWPYGLVLAACIGACAPSPPAAEPAPQPLPPPSTDAAPDDDPGPMPIEEWEQQYARLLAACVSPQGLVDYEALARRAEPLGELVAALAPPRKFLDDRRRLAFLINAYNLLVLHRVIEHWPVGSVRKIDAFSEAPAFRVLGRPMSLDALRDLARGMHDPRVHAALCNATRSASPLRAEPYTAPRLDAQLDEQARRFVSDPVRNATVGGLALVSPIFRVYARDFRVEPYASVVVFLRTYAAPQSPLGRLLSRDPLPQIEYQDFNWTLNAR